METTNTTGASVQFRGQTKETGMSLKKPQPLLCDSTRTSDDSGNCKSFPYGRLVTVIVYVIGISMSAIILGVYYFFVWHPVPKIITFEGGETISESTSFVRSVRRG